ncbi:MAG: UbiX family flavin prenyltransferase [Leptospiraceae bacterium]|nr:UbiX family flavin prenyltransferase [Leptospiraceae bacterium]MDW7975878.1 flavin prenyltransferase UbiX [Leptospiraceae bacterium]
MEKNSFRFVIGISGASGIIYGVHFLKTLASHVKGESHVIISEAAKLVLAKEMEITIKSDREFIEFCLKDITTPQHEFILENNKNLGAKPASGSYLHDGMIIIPCSMKTISGIANGYSNNLIERAADVVLKERRKLIVVPRETPLNLIHIENMRKILLAGGIVLPASPGFYHKPKTIEDLLNFISGKILNLLGIPQNVFSSWKG